MEIEGLFSIINTDENREIIKEAIKQCRRELIKQRDEINARVISPSNNMLNVVMYMLAEMSHTGKNFFTRINSVLKEISQYATLKDLKKNMTRLFVDNGIGDFVSSGKTSHIVYILKDVDGNIAKRTMPEAIFSMYFNEKFLDILKEKFFSDKLDYESLRKQISSSKRSLNIISSNKKTRIFVTEYINGSVTVNEDILIERNTDNNTGTYKKKAITTVVDVDGEAKTSITEETRNNFVSKPSERRKRNIDKTRLGLQKGNNFKSPEIIIEGREKGE